MIIIPQKPPNFEEIVRTFPVVATQKGILYCWDDAIYNPDSVEVSPALFDHEAIHSGQQSGYPDVWWNQYLRDPIFRFEQELEAHRAEYHAYCRSYKDRNQRVRYLFSCAQRLSSELYGNCVTFPQAMKLIRS